MPTNLTWVIIETSPFGIVRRHCARAAATRMATAAIASVPMARLALDPYVVDVLLPDLVAHDRKPSAYLVYFYLHCAAVRLRRDEVPVSLQTIATQTGLSKSSVQAALRHLRRRG